MDSFLDRSLELAIHALAPQWEPALQEGKLKLPPKHLAYLLEKKNSPEMLSSIRAMLSDRAPAACRCGCHAAALPVSLAQHRLPPASFCLSSPRQGTVTTSPLARRVAGAKDPATAAISSPMLADRNRIEPAANATGDLTASSRHAKLIGLWKLTALAPKLKALLDRQGHHARDSKRHALIALARLDAEHDLILKLSRDTQQPWLVRLGAIEALCERHVAEASTSPPSPSCPTPRPRTTCAPCSPLSSPGRNA